MKAWLKGGIIGAILLFILEFGTPHTTCELGGDCTKDFIENLFGWILKPVNSIFGSTMGWTTVIIHLVYFFIIGAIIGLIIGFIVGKIKSKKQISSK